MDQQELLKGLLDRLVVGLREVEAWDEYVHALMDRDDINEMESLDLSDEQIAAMSFWRMNGVEADEDGEVQSVFDTEPESPDDDMNDAVIVSLADWLMTFEKEELPEFKSDYSFEALANMCRGIYEIEIEVARQKSVISVHPEGNRAKRVQQPLYPLSDELVDEILRKRRGFGVRG